MMLSSVERVLELNIWMMSHIYKRVEYSLYNALTTILLRKRFFSGVFLNSYVGSSRAIVNEKTKKPHKIDLCTCPFRKCHIFCFWFTRLTFYVLVTFYVLFTSLWLVGKIFEYVNISTNWTLKLIIDSHKTILTCPGIDKSRTCVRDALLIINFTNCCTWIFFKKYAHEHTFSFAWVREVPVNHFRKKLHLRSSTGLWIYLWDLQSLINANVCNYVNGKVIDRLNC